MDHEFIVFERCKKSSNVASYSQIFTSLIGPVKQDTTVWSALKTVTTTLKVPAGADGGVA